MAEDGDSSTFQRTVILRDWWLIKCSKEFEGKRFGVAGTEISSTVEIRKRPMRGVFTSSPIIKAFDVFTLQASDGICIILRGFLNKERVVHNGFLSKISSDFVFGFPPCWEQICDNCFVGDSSISDKGSLPILSPCKYTNRNLEDSPARSRDKSAVTEKKTVEMNVKDGHSGNSRKSLRLQSKSCGKRAEEGKKVELSTDDGDRGSEGLDKASNSDVEKDEYEAVRNEVISPADGCGADNVATRESPSSEQERGELKVTRASSHSQNKDLDKSNKPGKKGTSKKSGKTLRSKSGLAEPMNHSATNVQSAADKRKVDVSKVQNPTTNGEDHGSKGSDNANCNDVEKDDCVAINSEVISPMDGVDKRHSATDRVENLTSKNATKESPTSKQRKGKSKETKASLYSQSKDRNNSSKPGEKGESKKSRKTLSSDSNVVKPMNHSRSRIKETIRKLNFDLEVTPDKEVKKQKTSAVSTDSLGQRRSRSGRVLVSSLEFWRNQIPVYDLNRNLTQVKEGHEANSTSSKGKRTVVSKAKKMKT